MQLFNFCRSAVPGWNWRERAQKHSDDAGMETTGKQVRTAGALGFLVRDEKRLEGALFLGVRTDHLDVLLPQLLRSLGYPREVLLGFLLRSPSLQHLRVTHRNLQLINC